MSHVHYSGERAGWVEGGGVPRGWRDSLTGTIPTQGQALGTPGPVHCVNNSKHACKSLGMKCVETF